MLHLCPAVPGVENAAKCKKHSPETHETGSKYTSSSSIMLRIYGIMSSLHRGWCIAMRPILCSTCCMMSDMRNALALCNIQRIRCTRLFGSETHRFWPGSGCPETLAREIEEKTMSINNEYRVPESTFLLICFARPNRSLWNPMCKLAICNACTYSCIIHGVGSFCDPFNQKQEGITTSKYQRGPNQRKLRTNNETLLFVYCFFFGCSWFVFVCSWFCLGFLQGRNFQTYPPNIARSP